MKYNIIAMKLLLSLFSLLWCCSSYAQEFVVSTPNFNNVLNIGLPNMVKVVVANTPCSDINLVLDSAKVEGSGIDCEYLIDVYKQGKSTLKVYTKYGKLIGEQSFLVKSLLDYPIYPVIAGADKGTIRRNALRVQQGLWGEVRIPGNYIQVKIRKYTLVVLRDGKALYSKAFDSGSFFNEEVKNILKNLELGDKMIVCDVWGYNSLLTNIRMLPLELSIVD